MRIVHEVYNEMQVGGTGQIYVDQKADKPLRGQVDLLFAAEGENIYIEGDIDHVEQMLCDALDAVKSIRELWKMSGSWPRIE